MLTALEVSNASKVTAYLVKPLKSASLAVPGAVLRNTVDAEPDPLRVSVNLIEPPSTTAALALAALELTE